MIVNLLLIIFTAGCSTEKTHPYSMYGIGSRIEGDHLLVTDLLKSPTQSVTPRNHTIDFKYPLVNKVISYIELSSNSNVFAEFVLSVDEKNANGQIFIGTVTAFKALEFYLKISIFGFEKSEMPTGFQPILYPNIDVAGAMEPLYDDENGLDDDYYDDGDEDQNVLVIGERQPGDEIIHETVQFSETTDIRSNHSVQFYYIDANYITLAKFTTIQTTTATAVYSHVSEHSLNAIIQDTNTFNLDVKLQLYGFKPENVPVDYSPPLSSIDLNRNLDELNKKLTTDMAKIQTEILNEMNSKTLKLTPTETATEKNECNNGMKIKSKIFYLFNIFIGFILVRI